MPTIGITDGIAHALYIRYLNDRKTDGRLPFFRTEKSGTPQYCGRPHRKKQFRNIIFHFSNTRANTLTTKLLQHTFRTKTHFTHFKNDRTL